MNVFGEKQQHQQKPCALYSTMGGLKLFVKSNIKFPMMIAIPFYIPFTAAVIKYDTIIPICY